MDRKVIQQRKLRKKRQLFMRKVIRLVSCVVGAILAMVLVFNLVINPLAKKISGTGSEPEEVQAQAPEVDPTQAVRVPVKDQSNTSKATALTVGWHEDENGKWYQNADGTYFANGLIEVDGNTYYVDENGYVQTGWIEVDGVDYMFDDNGVYDPTQKRKLVALTFDDGPGKYTMDLLNCLEENGAHATFFMLGQNVGLYPDEVKKMQEIGCELGNHSYDHPQLTSLSGDQVSEEFARTNSELENIVGVPATVARTPYGAQDETTLSHVGLPCFMWNIDTLDWSTMNADSTYNTTMDSVTDGDIVLMHDIHEPSVEAAKRIIPALIEKGYKLVTVSELAKAKGVTLEAGKSYTDFCDATVAALTGNTDSSSADSSTDSDSSVDSGSTDSDSDTDSDVNVDSDSSREE